MTTYDGQVAERLPAPGTHGAPQSRRSLHSDPRRIGLYDAYLSTLGGGENFLAVLAEFLEHEYPEAEIELVTYKENSVPIEALARRFGVELARSRIRSLFPKTRGYLAGLRPAQRVMHERDVAKVSAEYDLFVNNTIFSLAPPRSEFSIYMCMFPLDPRPSRMAKQGVRGRVLTPCTAVRRYLCKRWIGAYDLLLANSRFTRDWIHRLWGLESQVLYPPIETKSGIDFSSKRNAILSIGRFFPGNHNKKHAVLIETFSRLLDDGLEGWELHLVGGRTQVPGTDAYIDRLERQAAGLPVIFHIDADRADLEDLLENCSIFWHATGYGEDTQEEPEKLEHFGMSTVESMTNGCVPVVYSCGGQPEIIEHGRSGYLWTSLEEFRCQTMRLIRDPELWESMARRAHGRSQRFSRAAFRDAVRDLLARWRD